MTYLYACSECKQRFEAQQRISESPLQTCDLCGKYKCVERVPNNEGGFALHGSGWTPKFGKE